jgi:hypothetical protein
LGPGSPSSGVGRPTLAAAGGSGRAARAVSNRSIPRWNNVGKGRAGFAAATGVLDTSVRTGRDWHPAPAVHRPSRAPIPARSCPRLLTGMSRPSTRLGPQASLAARVPFRQNVSRAAAVEDFLSPRPPRGHPARRDRSCPTCRTYRYPRYPCLTLSVPGAPADLKSRRAQLTQGARLAQAPAGAAVVPSPQAAGADCKVPTPWRISFLPHGLSLCERGLTPARKAK